MTARAHLDALFAKIAAFFGGGLSFISETV